MAFSSSRRRAAERLRPARLMKNWIMRTPEPGPFGLTDRRAMVRAIVAASLVKRSLGGRVETVLTFPLHRLRLFFSAMGSWTSIGHARPVRARVACYILGQAADVRPLCPRATRPGETPAARRSDQDETVTVMVSGLVESVGLVLRWHVASGRLTQAGPRAT